MATSTFFIDPEDFKKILDSINQQLEDYTRQFAHALWTALLSFLVEYWLPFVVVLFVIFVALTIKAMFGRWGSLGSFLYNFFYFGILFVIGLIWGPNFFLGDFFHAFCAAILYPICYRLVGYVLEKMGLK
jgi:lipopolysaccharide export LptBFGC system permease protein LptF